jgi:hypothetical protein
MSAKILNIQTKDDSKSYKITEHHEDAELELVEKKTASVDAEATKIVKVKRVRATSANKPGSRPTSGNTRFRPRSNRISMTNMEDDRHYEPAFL